MFHIKPPFLHDVDTERTLYIIQCPCCDPSGIKKLPKVYAVPGRRLDLTVYLVYWDFVGGGGVDTAVSSTRKVGGTTRRLPGGRAALQRRVLHVTTVDAIAGFGVHDAFHRSTTILSSIDVVTLLHAVLCPPPQLLARWRAQQ